MCPGSSHTNLAAFCFDPCSMDHPKDWPLQQGICQKIPPVVHHDLHHKPERCWKNPSFFWAFQARIWAVIRAMTSIWHLLLGSKPGGKFPPNGPRFRGLQKEVGKFLTMVPLNHLVTGMISPSSLLGVVSFGVSFFKGMIRLLMNDRIFCWYHVVVDVLDVSKITTLVSQNHGTPQGLLIGFHRTDLCIGEMEMFVCLLASNINIPLKSWGSESPKPPILTCTS